MLNKYSNKQKVISFLFILITGFVSIYMIQTSYLSKMKELITIKHDLQNINLDILILRKHEKDFLSRKNLRYIKAYKITFANLEENVNKLQLDLTKSNKSTLKFVEFNKLINNYSKAFLDVGQQQEIIGLNHTIGLYGTLRKSIQEVQNSVKKTNNYELLSKIYNLRKYEKDFMLRKDIKYYDKYIKAFNTLFLSMQNKGIKKNLLKYKNDFTKLVNAEKKIGLDRKVGLRGEMRLSIHKTDYIRSTLNNDIEKFIKNEIADTKQLIILSLVILLIMILTCNFILTSNKKN